MTFRPDKGRNQPTTGRLRKRRVRPQELKAREEEGGLKWLTKVVQCEV